MAATTSKKGKKKKGQTLDLSTFLGAGNNTEQDGKTIVSVSAKPTWADEVDADEVQVQVEHVALPTAPRAARQEIDLSRIPERGPYTAYAGNLSYDVDEDLLAEFFSKLKCSVESAKLVRENGRMKGYGYVTFTDKQSLIEALKQDGEFWMTRKLKVDLSNNQDRESRSGFDSGRSNPTGFSDADNDWRGSTSRETPSYQQSSSFGRNRDDRDGPSRYNNNPSEADTSDSWARAGPRSEGTRSSGFNRDSGFSSNRGQDDRSGDFGPRRDYGGRRDGGGRYNSYNSSGRDGHRTAHHYDGYNRNGRYDDRGMDRQSEAPKERPKLQLTRRTVPAESEKASSTSSGSAAPFGGAKPVDTAAREREIEERLRRQQEDTRPSHDSRDSAFGSRDIRTNVERRIYNSASDSEPSRVEGRPEPNGEQEHKPASPEQKPAPQPVKKPAADPFGKAKPVDTAAREREIEEKLRKESNTSSDSGPAERKYNRDDRDHPRDRDYHRDGRDYRDGGDNYRESRDGHWEGRDSHRDSYRDNRDHYRDGRDSYRDGRDSYRDGRDSYRDGRDSYRDNRDSYRDNQDSHRDGRDSHRDGRDSHRDGRDSHRDGRDGRDHNNYETRDYNSSRDSNSSSRGNYNSSGGSRDSYNKNPSRDAPKESAWGRGPPVVRSGAGLRKEKKERPLPQSIDEMPKYKETEGRDFSDQNKYAGLLGSDGEHDQDD